MQPKYHDTLITRLWHFIRSDTNSNKKNMGANCKAFFSDSAFVRSRPLFARLNFINIIATAGKSLCYYYLLAAATVTTTSSDPWHGCCCRSLFYASIRQRTKLVSNETGASSICGPIARLLHTLAANRLQKCITTKE